MFCTKIVLEEKRIVRRKSFGYRPKMKPAGQGRNLPARAENLKNGQLSLEQRRIVAETAYHGVEPAIGLLERPLHEMKSTGLEFIKKRLEYASGKLNGIYSKGRKAAIERILEKINAVLEKRKADLKKQGH